MPRWFDWHNPALRVLFHLPVLLFRWRLGWLFGHRLALVTHLGRHSGRRYRTALEVVRYDRATGEVVVVSGWGARADWYRNLRTRPALEVASGRRHFQPVQRFLSPAEVERELRDYQRRHPFAFRVILRLFGYDPRTPASLRRFAAGLRMVAFRPAPDAHR